MSRNSHDAVSSGCEICSFDVFDTVLFRRTGPPETVFIMMEEQWIRRFSVKAPMQFAEVRSRAESRVREQMRRDTVTIHEIYRDVAQCLSLDASLTEEIIRFELEVERSVLLPCPEGVKIIEQCREAGRRVVFLSDMYLPPEFIEQILTERGIRQESENVYVSSALGVSKASGEMFGYVQASLGVSPQAFFHSGDSYEVDVKAALQHGWLAGRIAGSCFTNREFVLWDISRTTRNMDYRVAGAARSARLEATSVHDVSTAVALSLGASVAGPLLTAYAVWVLRQAEANNLEELYFLSRDGQVVFEICSILLESGYSYRPKLTYVYGSRQVWAFFALAELPTDEQADFYADVLAHASESLTDCLELLDLDGSQDLVGWRKIMEAQVGPALNRTSRKMIYQALLDDPTAHAVLERKIAENSDLYTDHLRQVARSPGAAAGVVDIGWSGRWTVLVADMFEQVIGKRPLGFQIGRYGKAGKEHIPTLECFLFDQATESGISGVPGWFVPLVESFCGADHGRITRMERRNGVVCPVESDSRCAGVPEASFAAFRNGIRAFARSWHGVAPRQTLLAKPEGLIEICRRFWEFPSREEAAFLASVDVGMAPNADCDRRLLRPYTWADVLKLVTTGHLPGFEPLWWHRGSLALTSSRVVRLVMFSGESCIAAMKQLVKSPASFCRIFKKQTLKWYLKSFRWLLTSNE